MSFDMHQHNTMICGVVNDPGTGGQSQRNKWSTCAVQMVNLARNIHPDFRHLTKDKVVSFVSMLPRMDPEVAKHALEQFPAFAETNLAIVSCLKDSLGAIVSENTGNMGEFNVRCQEALATLEAELKREDLTDEGRKMVIDGIMGIIAAIGQKDSENKEFLSRLFADLLRFGTIALVILAAPLGLKLSRSIGAD